MPSVVGFPVVVVIKMAKKTLSSNSYCDRMNLLGN
jgi:hypothetical protein